MTLYKQRIIDSSPEKEIKCIYLFIYNILVGRFDVTKQ